MTVFILIILIILLITNNQLVLNGASYGLMLWYENVLPLLLPFMLISGLLENSVMKSAKSGKSGSKLAIPTILILGIFCGYPIGAKTNGFFVEQKLLNKRMGNILLPICNNVSPMFFLGFIMARTLNNYISPIIGYISLYLPYIIILILEILLYPRKTDFTLHNNHNHSIISNQARSISEQSINQITHVGLYIMLCSIITEFILSFNFLSPLPKLVLTGITEITSGVTYIGNSSLINDQIKTALILGLSSFGGISSVMQTAKVIQGSGLSLIHYILVKVLCATGTYFLCLLII